MKPNLLNITSGIALGCLIGLLIGLSVSEVVGTVLGALTSLLVAFFGLKSGDEAGLFSKPLITAFCISCICFVLLGIFIRTRNYLAPSAAFYKKELSELGLSKNEITRIILLKKYGITLDAAGAANIVKFEPEAQDKSAAGSLFAAEAGSPAEVQQIVERFQKKPYDSLAYYVKANGLAYEQFYNSMDIDIKDTTIKKNILLQLIAITHKK